MHRVALIACFLALLILQSNVGSGRSLSPDKPQEIQSPAGNGSGEPNLTTAADGRVYLSWLEPVQPKGHALRLAVRSKGGAWSTLPTIAQGGNWFVNWADFPSILALPDGSLAAHWLAKSAPGTYAYNVNVSLSRDGGKTWSKPILPHRDGTPNEHGFVSMVPEPSGGLAAVWLDGRKMKGGGEHSERGPSSNEMTLMYTTIAPDGKLGDEVLLDGRVCECCQTSAANTPNGMTIVYRDRSEKEIRDIAIVRVRNGKASEPQPLSKDGWEINGCPVNGPAISSAGNNVAVAWFTGAEDQARVNAVLSSNGGMTFGAPIRIDDGNPLGRVGMIALPSGEALVSWLEKTGKGAQVRLRRVLPNNSRGESITVSETGAARSSGFPRITKSGSEIIIAWTDTASGGKVRTAILALQ